MLRDCPHCYTSVIPKSDGTCPACCGVFPTDDVGATWCSLRITSGAVLPPVCYVCGAEADRLVAVVKSSDEGRDAMGRVAKGVIAALVSWPLALYMSLRGVYELSLVEVALPVCPDHADFAPPVPRHVDFANVAMTFLVHHRLRDAVRESVAG